MNINIRLVTNKDLPVLQNLFINTIKTICSNDYTPDQIEAWTSSVKNTERWIFKMNNQFFIVAEHDDKIIGMGSLENYNYLDFMYVHHKYVKKGIASILYQNIEKEAIKHNETFLFSDVSKTAKPFFEKKGFVILHENRFKINNIDIMNYRMRKELFIQ